MTDKEKIKQYVERQKSQAHTIAILGINSLSGYQLACDNIIDFIDSLQEEHINFPHERNIIDNVFGAGNLESWEYEEAKKLVLLAKEELLKDLEKDKEPASDGLEEEITKCYKSRNDLMMTRKQFGELIHRFTNWQHGKDFDDLLQSEMKFPKEYYEKGKDDAMKEMKETLQTEYEKGRFDMREEMMKDAVGAQVFQVHDIEKAYEGYVYIVSNQFKDINLLPPNKVKIIIIKLEQQ